MAVVAGWTIGSSWKPINLIAWMEAGHSINDNLQTSTVIPHYGLQPAVTIRAVAELRGTCQNAMGAGTVNPESPFLGLVRSHNTTQASMGAILKLCKVADTATELGYHDAATGETIDKDLRSYTPSMMVGSVNVSPLTMASIFAVYASNGVQCNPIAISKVTDKDGNDLKVPSANCHQAVDKDIIQTLAYTLNQGTVRSGWCRLVTSRLADGRKSFGKTGTSEDLAVSGGSFIPNQIAAFAVGRRCTELRTPTVFPTFAINGRVQQLLGWFDNRSTGRYATSSIAYIDPRRKYRLTTITAKPVCEVHHDWQVSGHWRTNVQRAADHYEWQQPIAEQQQSVSVAEHWAKQHPNPGHQFRAVE